MSSLTVRGTAHGQYCANPDYPLYLGLARVGFGTFLSPLGTRKREGSRMLSENSTTLVSIVVTSSQPLWACECLLRAVLVSSNAMPVGEGPEC